MTSVDKKSTVRSLDSVKRDNLRRELTTLVNRHPVARGKNHFMVWHAIADMTLGYRRLSDHFSHSDIAEVTGIDPKNVGRYVKDLVQIGVISYQEGFSEGCGKKGGVSSFFTIIPPTSTASGALTGEAPSRVRPPHARGGGPLTGEGGVPSRVTTSPRSTHEVTHEREGGDANGEANAEPVAQPSSLMADDRKESKNQTGGGMTPAERANYLTTVFEALHVEAGLKNIWLSTGTKKQIEHVVRGLLEQSAPEKMILAALGYSAVSKGLADVRWLGERVTTVSARLDADSITDEQAAIAAGAHLVASEQAQRGMTTRERQQAARTEQSLTLDQMEAAAAAAKMTLTEWGAQNLSTAV